MDAARVPVVGDEQVLDVDQSLAVEAAARERRRAFLLFTLRVSQVHELVLRELRVDGDFEQPALPDREHLGRPGHRRRVERAAADDAQLPGLLGDEHVAVRQEREAPRRRQPLEHRHDANGRADGFDNLRRVGEWQGGGALEGARRRSLSSATLTSACGRLLRRAGAAAAQLRPPWPSRSPPQSRSTLSVSCDIRMSNLLLFSRAVVVF